MVSLKVLQTATILFAAFTVSVQALQMEIIDTTMKEATEKNPAAGGPKSSLGKRPKNDGFKRKDPKKTNQAKKRLLAKKKDLMIAEKEEQDKIDAQKNERNARINARNEKKKEQAGECSICLNSLYDRPSVRLPCDGNHENCRDCMKKLCKTQGAQGKSVICPLDRTDILQGLPAEFRAEYDKSYAAALELKAYADELDDLEAALDTYAADLDAHASDLQALAAAQEALPVFARALPDAPAMVAYVAPLERYAPGLEAQRALLERDAAGLENRAALLEEKRNLVLSQHALVEELRRELHNLENLQEI